MENYDIIAYIVNILYKNLYDISDLLFVSKLFYKIVGAQFVESISNNFCDGVYSIDTITKYITASMRIDTSFSHSFYAINNNIQLKICYFAPMGYRRIPVLDIHFRKMSLRYQLINGKYIITPCYNQNTAHAGKLLSFVKKYMLDIFIILQ